MRCGHRSGDGWPEWTSVEASSSDAIPTRIAQSREACAARSHVCLYDPPTTFPAPALAGPEAERGSLLDAREARGRHEPPEGSPVWQPPFELVYPVKLCERTPPIGELLFDRVVDDGGAPAHRPESLDGSGGVLQVGEHVPAEDQVEGSEVVAEVVHGPQHAGDVRSERRAGQLETSTLRLVHRLDHPSAQTRWPVEGFGVLEVHGDHLGGPATFHGERPVAIHRAHVEAARARQVIRQHDAALDRAMIEHSFRDDAATELEGVVPGILRNLDAEAARVHAVLAFEMLDIRLTLLMHRNADRMIASCAVCGRPSAIGWPASTG